MSCRGPYLCPGCSTCAAIEPCGPLTVRDEAKITAALADYPPIYGRRPLRLVQQVEGHTTYSAPKSCDGSYSCDCPRCQDQRSALVGGGPKKVKQPWEVRLAA